MRERCLMCMCWHEPGEHKMADVPEVLTGQVPVSGNPTEREYDDS